MESSPVIKKVWTSQVAVLIDRLKRVDSGTQISTPYFVFKINKDLRKNIEVDDNAKGQIFSRATGKPVYLLECDEKYIKHEIYQVHEHAVRHVDDSNLIKDIRQFDLLEVIKRTGRDCILEAPSGTHFITPSDKHTTKFLRLGDALYSYNAMDRISYWLQPEMASAAGVLIDTWSLSSIILRSQQLLGRDVPFDCFRQHIRNDEENSVEVLNKLLRKMDGDGSLLCLVSISSSGLFMKKLSDLVHEAQVINIPKILSIFRFKNSPPEIEALATLDFDSEWYNESDCIYCSSGERRETYQIDRKYYDTRLFQEETIKFSARLLQDKDQNKSAASKFIHEYGKLPGVLRVHRDDPNDGINPRHHAFYIDVVTLLKCDSFKAELHSALKKIKAAEKGAIVVVTPPHDAGELLAKIACDLLNAKHVCHQNLRNISSEEKNLITSATQIVFLDDVLITGSRITGYLTALREEFKDELIALKKVTWFPVIARPSNEKNIAAIKDALGKHTWKNELMFLHEILLPDWSKYRDCPWCQELKIFDREVGPSFEEPEWYSNRRETLMYRTGEGIATDPLFLFPGIERDSVASGSPIADKGSNEMQVLFLLATGLQGLRNSDKPLGRGLFQRYVLSMHDQDCTQSTFQRFSEAIFQAAFLRIVRNDEWDRHAKSKGTEYLAAQARRGVSNVLLGESILYLHRSGFMGPLHDNFRATLKKWDDAVLDSLVNRFEK